MFICCICCDIMTNESHIGASIPCGHCYHVKCISKWLKKRENCPKCDQKVESVTRIYLDSSDQCKDDIVDELLKYQEKIKRELVEKENNLKMMRERLEHELSEMKKNLTISRKNLIMHARMEIA